MKPLVILEILAGAYCTHALIHSGVSVWSAMLLMFILRGLFDLLRWATRIGGANADLAQYPETTMHLPHTTADERGTE